MSKEAKPIAVVNTITVISQRYTMDWVMEDKHEIVLNDVWGIELYWRGESWHVGVKTKKKQGEDGWYTYELSHWVFPVEVRKLVQNPLVKILRITNTHSSDNFAQEVANIFSQL